MLLIIAAPHRSATDDATTIPPAGLASTAMASILSADSPHTLHRQHAAPTLEAGARGV
jgi:hypothetical protein